VEELAVNMRLADRREITRQRPGVSLQDIVREAVEVSLFSRCCIVDDRVMAIWGLHVPLLIAGDGYPWCMTTSVVESHLRLVIALTRRYVMKMREITPTLVANVDINHPQAVRWLSWAGFSTKERIDVNGYSFVVARMGAP